MNARAEWRIAPWTPYEDSGRPLTLSSIATKIITDGTTEEATVNDLFLVLPDADNSAWNTPGDLASDRGQYELRISFNATDITQAGMLGNMALLELEKWDTEIVSVQLSDSEA